MRDGARSLVERYVAVACPWLLSSDEAAARREALSEVVRGALGANEARALEGIPAPPPAIAAFIDALDPGPVGARLLAAFFMVESSWPAQRWLAELGVSATTHSGEITLSTQLLAAAFVGPSLSATALRDGIAALVERGMLHPADADRGERDGAGAHFLPRALSRYAATELGSESPAIVELSSGLTLHEPAEATLAAAVRAAFPGAATARHVVASEHSAEDAAMVAGALAAESGRRWLLLDGRLAPAPTAALAMSLAAADDRVILVLYAGDTLDSEALAARLALARSSGRPRFIAYLPSGAPRPFALAGLPALAAPHSAAALAADHLAGLDERAGRAIGLSGSAGARLGVGLEATVTALRRPELLASVEEAARRRIVETRGLDPLVAPPPEPLLSPVVRELLAEPISFLRGRGAIGARYGKLAPSSVVLQLLGEDAGLERAAVAWLGEALGCQVLRMEAAGVLSRWAGEAEQNLRRRFSAAEELGAILYLPAAESLLGRRLDVQSTHDRSANLQVNYLLQLLESYSGVFVFSTERDRELDPALRRRVMFKLALPPLGVAERAGYLASLLSAADARGLDLARAAALAPLTVAETAGALFDTVVAAAAEGARVDQAYLERAIRELATRR